MNFTKCVRTLTTRIRPAPSLSANVASFSSKPELKDELEFYRQKADHWWDRNGEFGLLHSLNGLRVPLIVEGLGCKGLGPFPLKEKTILDVGCGGGILSEALSRLGATVTGIDLVEESLAVARLHAARDPKCNVNYKCVSIEELAAADPKPAFDAVVVSEVLEHIDNLPLFVSDCIHLIKEGGSFFVTTINKTFLSYLLAIQVAENVLRLVPRGTHSWDKFVTPEQLEKILQQNNCVVVKIMGMLCNPLTGKWDWISNSSVNYALHAVKKPSINVSS